MIRQLDIPIYDTDVLFVLDPTKEEMDEFLNSDINRKRFTDEEFKKLFEELDGPFGGYTCKLDKGGYLVVIKKDYSNVLYYDHELYHLANMILWDREVEHTREDEPYAYLKAWITNQYLQGIILTD